ncbi:Trx7/PDZ domain-containing (seleno)protein [Singulisphaera sp. Ch08]|uniref:Trx7/PDZ domain-containing (Seleno)protein n=1 Tax=Singulisphaera sp. Ch08 TaxID=3120278 RepID=A0AAU7C826_9BACT
MRPLLLTLGVLIVATQPIIAQDRETKVRNDRKSFETSKDWVYNNLDEGLRIAKESGKPMFVIFRCIPCEACQEFDDDVASRDPMIRDLMDQFVCVRIVQANTIDLSHFRFDFDQSFAAFLMDSNLTIYGRFGTRSDRKETEDISLTGLRKAMEAALRMHANAKAIKPSLAGKQVRPTEYKTPLDYPSLAARFGSKLNYEGNVVKSCMHCHQVREAERSVYRAAGKPIPDEVLYPYPDPAVLGLTMNPQEMATVEKVAAGSTAERAGLKPGDQIVALDGQPLLSIADLQWVLHNTAATAQLAADVKREGAEQKIRLDLPEGWRRGNISWRVTTWDLRRMGFGGMIVVDTTDEERQAAKIAPDRMALRVKFVGAFGEHAVAKNAGIRKDDIIVGFDGLEANMTESQLLAYAVQKKQPGDQVAVTVLRDGKRETRTITLR